MNKRDNTRQGVLLRRFADLRQATNGAIDLYYSYSPGDRYGRRWAVKANGSDRTMSTREAEAFVLGAYSALPLVGVR